MPFGQVTVALPAYELQPAQAAAQRLLGPPTPAPQTVFVTAGTPMPGNNPAAGVTQNLQETMAQYAAMLPTITSTNTPTGTDFMVTLPGGSSFDLTALWNNYWWAVALGAAVLFWPKGKGRR